MVFENSVTAGLDDSYTTSLFWDTHSQQIYVSIFLKRLSDYKYTSQNDTKEYNSANALPSEQSLRINTSQILSSVA